MQRSESINELATALAKAQAEIEGALKSNLNPHFRSQYADLGSVWAAIREPLTKHGLSIVQLPRRTDGGNVEVETTMFHASGQWISDTLGLPVGKQDAQGYGSAITYCRRYALQSIAGIAPIDDDGNAAVGAENTPPISAKSGAEKISKNGGLGDMGRADLWKEWASGDQKSDCGLWLNRAANELRELVSLEDLDKWLSGAENKKHTKALHDHHEKRFDWLMGKIEARRDELRAKEAA